MKTFCITYFFLLCIVGAYLAPMHAQESCYEQYLREHNKKILTAEDADDSYDELKKTVLAKQMYGDSYLLMVDTIAQRVMITKVDGTYIADVHLTLVDSTWYMWLSVDPLADKYPGNSPYMYCNGNPIMLVDLYGEEPTEEEAAAMAAYAYGDIDLSVNDENTRAFKEQLGDWEPIRTDVSLLTGYRAVMFSRAIDGTIEYAYAFAGTDFKSFADIGADIRQLLGNASSQYEMAIAFAKSFSATLSGLELSFVGHSLGGGLATASAKATGRTAITFNPAALNLRTIKRYGLNSSATIRNYVVEGDPVTTGQKNANVLFGGYWLLKTLINQAIPANPSLLLILPGQTTTVAPQAGNAHTISNFIK